MCLFVCSLSLVIFFIREFRVHDTKTSGCGAEDLRYLQTNMLEADVTLAGGDCVKYLIGSLIWGSAWSTATFLADFSCFLNLISPILPEIS